MTNNNSKITNPKEIMNALKDLIADDSGEDIRIETPDAIITKGIDYDGHTRYRLYSANISVAIIGNGGYLDGSGKLYITLDGKRIGFYFIGA